jgi:hypothetical protein
MVFAFAGDSTTTRARPEDAAAGALPALLFRVAGAFVAFFLAFAIWFNLSPACLYP